MSKSVHILRNADDKADFYNLLMGFDKPMKVEVKRYQKRRSVAQNALYWGVWNTAIRQHFVEHAGKYYTKDQIHDWLGDLFLPAETYDINGEIHNRKKSTTQLSVMEFADYLNQIDIYCNNELELRLPQPADTYYEAMGHEN